MKKKVLSALLVTTMGATLLAGCGAKDNNKTENTSTTNTANKEETKTETADTTTAETTEATAEGKVLNIFAWNEEFKSRMISHYPGYTEVDGTTGTIGDVTVKWNITPSEGLAYQNNLDATLLKQADAPADEKIDIFLVEADYAGKYCQTDYTMDIKDLGLTDADVANQYPYTKEVVSDANGAIKALSWQACPAGLIYNRNIAKEVLGSDDPATVQTFVSDWDTFTKTADTLKKAGYFITSSVNDTYRVYSNNVTTPWVVDGKLNIDANIKAWVDNSKKLVEAGYTDTHDLWGDDWKRGFYDEGKVFCYFGPAWLIDYCMAADVDGSIANRGEWGLTSGPQTFCWGGTWICGATGTDNASLVKDIMYQLTCNVDVMKNIVNQDNDFINNQPTMEAMAAEGTYSSKVLGGMNPLTQFSADAAKIVAPKTTIYDQGCTEAFQGAMKEYFDGNTDYEGALDLFKTSLSERYPDMILE